MAPEMRNTHDGQKNHDLLAQAMLIGRYPGEQADWVDRYAAAFRALYVTDEGFRNMVNGELSDEALSAIQDRLNGHTES